MAEELLFQFRHRGPSEPSLAEVIARFGFREDELDPGYGIVKISEDGGGALYVVRVDAAARARLEPELQQEQADPAVGFFSSPRIEPFGLPEAGPPQA